MLKLGDSEIGFTSPKSTVNTEIVCLSGRPYLRKYLTTVAEASKGSALHLQGWDPGVAYIHMGKYVCIIYIYI